MSQNMMNQGMMNQQPQAPQMPPPPPQMTTYFVSVNCQQQGPFTMQQLQQMALGGSLTQSTFVWTAGMAAWQAAGSVQALAALFGAVPPPPLPPMP